MKKIIISLIIFVLVSILAVIIIVGNPIFFTSDVIKIKGVTNDVNPDRMYADAVAIIGENKPRYYTDLEELERSALYIENTLRESGCEIEVQEFELRGEMYKNVICSFNTDKSDRIIIGAHYDTQIVTPGADDNTSGVVGLLELSRLLPGNVAHVDHRLDLIAYTLEEAFFGSDDMGSFVHAAKLREEDQSVHAMISLEMIGYYSDEKDSQGYPLSIMKLFYPSEGNFIAVVGNVANWKLTRNLKKSFHEAIYLNTRSINAPTVIPGIDFSDHRGYWAHDYSAVMVTDTSFYRNPHYHKETDTIDTLDFDKIAEVVKGMYWYVRSGT